MMERFEQEVVFTPDYDDLNPNILGRTRRQTVRYDYETGSVLKVSNVSGTDDRTPGGVMRPDHISEVEWQMFLAERSELQRRGVQDEFDEAQRRASFAGQTAVSPEA